MHLPMSHWSDIETCHRAANDVNPSAVFNIRLVKGYAQALSLDFPDMFMLVVGSGSVSTSSDQAHVATSSNKVR